MKDQAYRFTNSYRCERCEHEWQDEWDCACDDDCPACGARHMTPVETVDNEEQEISP